MKKYLTIFVVFIGLISLWQVPSSFGVEDCGDTGCVEGPDEGTTTTEDDGSTTMDFGDPPD